MDIFGLNFRKDVLLQILWGSVSIFGNRYDMTRLTVNIKTTGRSYHEDTINLPVQFLSA